MKTKPKVLRKCLFQGLILLAVFTFTLPGTLALAQQGPEIRVTDCEERADQPDVAVDSDGNVHIVYFDECGSSEREIWYTMLDNEGNTLIDDTRLTNDTQSDKHPSVVLDSDDKVIVVFSRRATSEISFIQLDPSLDDQSGDAADPETIITVAVTDLTDNVDNYLTHPRVALDSNDDIHVVFEEDGNEVYYLKADNEGNILIPTIHIRVCSSWYGRPHLAVDSNDDVHIVWNDYENTDQDEIYYMMLDGATGSTLIDYTLITPDDDYSSKRQTIQIDSEDKLHIIWHDRRGSSNEIYYTKLDPSLDDQDGSAADLATITLIGETAVTGDDDITSKNPQTALLYDYIYLSWYQETDAGWDIFFKIMDDLGQEVLPETQLTTDGEVTYSTSAGDNAPNLEVDNNGKAHIVWCDYRDGYYEVYSTSFLYAMGVSPVDRSAPQAFQLRQNFPNPFNPQTTISYELMLPADVLLQIFNLEGQLLTTLVDRPLSAGSYLVEIDGTDLPSGVYFYSLRAGNQSQTRKMLLVK
ncbi:MAG: T9SS type A sorting domain-containing protein [Candidatus Delongbacteria bacterium]|nr:T9SS type A sorting domain-containing protein [Candidatus Delongbacteria bacterium]